MPFLVVFVFVGAILFGVDYVYFQDKDKNLKTNLEKKDLNYTKEKDEFIKKIFQD